MKAKDTLFHINWGDGDDTFVIAPDEETAKERMPDGKDMVNYIVRLDLLYQRIFKAGIKEVVLCMVNDFHFSPIEGSWHQEKWDAKLKEWGLSQSKILL